MKRLIRRLAGPLAFALDIYFLCFSYLTRGLAYILPPSALYSLYTGFGLLLYRIVPGARRRLMSTVSEAMPEVTEDEARHIARSVYGELFKPMVDLAVFKRHGDRLFSEISPENFELVDELDARGKGLIIITGHVGGWAVAVATLTRLGYMITPLYIHPDKTLTRRTSRSLYDLGTGLGGDPEDPYIFTGEDAIRQAREILNKGKRLASATDIGGKRVVEFFGRPAAFADGTGHFACDSGAPILYGCVLRDERGIPRRIIAEKEVHYELTGDRDTDVTTIMQACMKALEENIRKYPDQWTQWGALQGWWKRAEQLGRRETE